MKVAEEDNCSSPIQSVETKDDQALICSSEC
ncbi:hypothetical protein AAZX31_02G112500 [Glycine max]